ncbi:MAG TPA: phage portal protein [Gaiellaceae bacterium]|nr:phage portal protein [Gaiellaceae bacterium]
MTFEHLAIPGLSDDEERTVNRLLGQLLACRDDNLLRSSMYEGKQAAKLVGSVIPPQYARLSIALGWSGKAVDSLTRRTKVERFAWADGDLDSLGMRELEEANQVRSQIGQALTDSATHGPSFLITTKGAESEPEALLHVKDALNCTGTWNARVHRLTDALSVTSWDAQNPTRPTGIVLYLDGLTITADRVDGKWQVDRSEHPWGVPVEPLIYKPRPSRPWGSSRLSKPIMSLHMQALRELVRLEGHMDVYSYPEMWMLGADMSAFKNADGSQRAVWQVVLGRIKGLEDNPDKPDNLARADVKQFPAASPEPHVKALATFAKLFAREASLPDSAVAIEGLTNPTSAESYDASQYELIAEAEGACDDWTTPVARTIRRLLAIWNGEDGVPDSWQSIGPKWRDVRYQSKAAQADAGMKQLTAIPWLAETEVGLELLGLSEQQIGRALAERRRAAGRDVIAAAASGAAREDAATVKAKADAMGVLIRAGVSPESAARQVGMGVEFTGAVPVSLRLPEDQANRVEGK